MQKIICKDCNYPMESGYLFSKGLRDTSRIEWRNGTLETKWYGYKHTGDKKIFVKSYRCSRCKKIELYADEIMEN